MHTRERVERGLIESGIACARRRICEGGKLGANGHAATNAISLGGSMKRVTGIGGVFFKANDAPALQAWYKRYLGIDVQAWGGAAFTWADAEGKPVAGTTAWSIASAKSDQFAPSTATFMVNYRVEDLHALVKALREEGCNVLEKIDDSEYGKFAWVIDPEGNKLELWQPPAGQ
jgi:predicted enzyme related to lactoylglutathione lyase